MGWEYSPIHIRKLTLCVRRRAYAKEGLTSHHGLPRSLFGGRFPDVGTITDHLDENGLVKRVFRKGFPENLATRDNWVYTHYPPGPNWLCGVMVRCFGIDHIQLYRLLPLAFGLLATAIFFRASAGAFGADRAAFIAGACAVLPMFHCCMPGLHYEGYSFALLLLQFSLLIGPALECGEKAGFGIRLRCFYSGSRKAGFPSTSSLWSH